MNYSIREMTIKDHEAVHSFWASCEGLNLDESDSIENLDIYLRRNPKLCYVALHKNDIVGAIKCGQDGRRGYLHHLAVHKDFRKLGIGKALIKICLDSLRSQGIKKCNLFVLDTNREALKFWPYNGWKPLDYFYRTFQLDLTE